MKQIKTILFDLDGTLLPVDMEKFLEIYFEEMGKHFAEHIEPKLLTKSVWEATGDLIDNTENRTNSEVFWETFRQMTGDNPELTEEKFLPFYEGGYQKAKAATGTSKAMQKAVSLLLENGYQIIVATNPLYPENAVHDRIRWAGFNPNDFSYISSLEKNCHCKPHAAFYEEIVNHLSLDPKSCMMVGNDAKEDMAAKKIGMTTYLVVDYLIKHDNEPIEADHMGSAEDFLEFVQSANQDS
ncbi:HAD hydrolase-like protein [Clostridia bacterium]|nr:HAD hydrolase-like protein [Clostridia bacterium]